MSANNHPSLCLLLFSTSLKSERETQLSASAVSLPWIFPHLVALYGNLPSCFSPFLQLLQKTMLLTISELNHSRITWKQIFAYILAAKSIFLFLMIIKACRFVTAVVLLMMQDTGRCFHGTISHRVRLWKYESWVRWSCLNLLPAAPILALLFAVIS